MRRATHGRWLSVAVSFAFILTLIAALAPPVAAQEIGALIPPVAVQEVEAFIDPMEGPPGTEACIVVLNLILGSAVILGEYDGGVSQLGSGTVVETGGDDQGTILSTCFTIPTDAPVGPLEIVAAVPSDGDPPNASATVIFTVTGPSETVPDEPSPIISPEITNDLPSGEDVVDISPEVVNDLVPEVGPDLSPDPVADTSPEIVNDLPPVEVPITDIEPYDPIDVAAPVPPVINILPPVSPVQTDIERTEDLFYVGLCVDLLSLAGQAGPYALKAALLSPPCLETLEAGYLYQLPALVQCVHQYGPAACTGFEELQAPTLLPDAPTFLPVDQLGPLPQGPIDLSGSNVPSFPTTDSVQDRHSETREGVCALVPAWAGGCDD